MKDLKRFEAFKLEKSKFHSVRGGATRTIVRLPSGGGGTGSTQSICHIDGVTDGDSYLLA